MACICLSRSDSFESHYQCTCKMCWKESIFFLPGVNFKSKFLMQTAMYSYVRTFDTQLWLLCCKKCSSFYQLVSLYLGEIKTKSNEKVRASRSIKISRHSIKFFVRIANPGFAKIHRPRVKQPGISENRRKNKVALYFYLFFLPKTYNFCKK